MKDQMARETLLNIQCRAFSLANCIQKFYLHELKFDSFEKRQKFKQKWLPFLPKKPLMPWDHWRFLRYKILEIADEIEKKYLYFVKPNPLSVTDITFIKLLVTGALHDLKPLLNGDWTKVSAYQVIITKYPDSCEIRLKLDTITFSPQSTLENMERELNDISIFLKENSSTSGEPS